ncbi:TIGR03086 family metal-binding protein [Gordonia soli]|uniref:Mycothiol-dependent maleylpyruvate isomerase metal-binding domain-containing protein n=1 Tax=Gordonia soli NBRC 108243 TaxID=1223545 RepID=M0QIT9_9ACTN|nr:TIGR03086 family metal-binding protein [Gordonia soli]GAC68463.1 hypothetical protein GS4_15_01130 [Gordonia soli NBRC 108243]
MGVVTSGRMSQQPETSGVDVYTAEISTAADAMASLAGTVRPDALDRPTPCDGTDVGSLLTHVIGLSAAFGAAGRKEFGPLTDTPPDPSAAGALPESWMADLTAGLGDLVQSWRAPSAWEGMTRAGGVEAPAEVLGTVALSELVLHGWDLARALGLDYDVPDAVLQPVFDLHHPPQPQSEREGMFGPVVEVPDDARLLHRLVGVAGREPFWPRSS